MLCSVDWYLLIIFGTTYRSRLRRSRVVVILKDETDRFSRNYSKYLPIYADLRNVVEEPRPLHSTVGQHLRLSSPLIELEVLEVCLGKDHTTVFLYNWPSLILVKQ